MKQNPLIGITSSRLLDNNPLLPGYPRAVVSTDYMEALTQVGAVPVVLPPVCTEEQLERYVSLCDGLLISGGKDISPMQYGEMTHPKCCESDPEVDESQLAIIRGMLEQNKPILGICRGSQLLNVVQGGSLYQDIASQLPQAGGHVVGSNVLRWAPCHTVRLAQGGLLASLFGKKELRVNSFHHQGAARLGDKVVLEAVAPDGMTEAFTIEGKKALAIQWHPEMMLQHDDEMLPIFQCLADACRQQD